jgi:two-component system, response regulator
MQEREVRLLVEKGHFNKALVVSDPGGPGWNVRLHHNAHEAQHETLSAKRGGARVFKTSDAAIAWCHEIGIKTVLFKLEAVAQQPPVQPCPTCDSILLVEDNDDDVMLTLRAFRKRNLEDRIVVKRDGREALDFLFADTRETSQQAHKLPCLILLDIKLPKLDGFDVLREIRNRHTTRLLPVIMLSSSREHRDVELGYDLGINSYLRKPTSQENFEEMIGRIEDYWLRLNVPPHPYRYQHSKF